MNQKICSHFARVVLIFIGFFSATAQEKPEIRFEDKIRIKEALEISRRFSDSIWDDFSKTPFTILLVTDNYEFLIHHPNPSEDFQLLGKDNFLNSDIYFRAQQLNKGFLATFPAVNGINCVVVGTPENTGLTSTKWIITLLHEHFHQYQYNSPNYARDALALGLSNGDETGMWQLNYPFPYDDVVVNKKYDDYTKALFEAVEKINDQDWKRTYKRFMKKRKAFKRALPENDYKYLSFQWYQEGVARFIEYAFLEILKDYKSIKEIELLTDFIPYTQYKDEFYTHHLKNVNTLKLSDHQRLAVYDVGFAESLILGKQNPGWKKDYLNTKFDLEKFHQ